MIGARSGLDWAPSDPLGLYNPTAGLGGLGGITRSGNAGSYTYSAIAGHEDKPVNYVSFYDTLRFATTRRTTPTFSTSGFASR